MNNDITTYDKEDAERTIADAIAEIAADQVHTHVDGQSGDVTLVCRADRETHYIQFDEKALPAPTRPRGTHTANTEQTFVDMFNDLNGPEGSSRIYSYDDTLLAVLNEHHGIAEAETEAGHGDHRIVFDPHHTDAYNMWTGHNRAWMGQTEFAEFLDEWGRFITEPAMADVMEMVENFKSTTNVKFESGQRMRDGSRQLLYTEEVDAKAGEFSIPETITALVTVYRRMAYIIEINARLQYRVNSGSVSFRFVCDDIDDQIDETRRAIEDYVESEVDILSVFHGQPPTARYRLS